MHTNKPAFSLCSLDRTNKGESWLNAFCTTFLKKELYTIIFMDVYASPTIFFLMIIYAMISGQGEKRNPTSSLLKERYWNYEKLHNHKETT